MKTTFAVVFVFLLLFYSCGNSDKKANNREAKKNSDNCGFDKFLNDPNTPKMAKELFNNTYQLKGDDPLVLLQNLDSKNTQKRRFYFRVITNSYKIADGSYSEGLGNAGKEYIENKTAEFASYFDDKHCFTDKDLETWADIAMLEFEIIIDEKDYNKPVIDVFINKLRANCKNGPSSQKETIDKFGKLLKTKWGDFLKKT